jgi:hypothetical protein
MKLEFAKIRLDGGTQPRAALNREVIADYCERMQEGIAFRPVIVFFDGENYWLADGFHRIDAAKQAQLTEIEADVVQGTQSDAQWYSYSVNKEHGLRRTNEDKERSVKAALAASYLLTQRKQSALLSVDLEHRRVFLIRDSFS